MFFVGEIGAPHTAKIVDFGLAKVAEQTGLTSYGHAVGTLHYMAPEQAVGDTVDPRTDVYGFGVLMYRAFAGRLPFEGDDEATVLAQQVFVTPPSPKLGQDRASRDLEAVIAKAMRKMNAHRYASMQALADDLAAVGIPGGKLAANTPLAAPDLYEPASPFSIKAAAFLKKRIP